MADVLVLGMPLDAEENDPIRSAQPLSAVVVVKALDDDGKICYFGGATEGLMSVEALGMLRYGLIKLEHQMMAREQEDD